MTTTASSVDPKEMEKFAATAADWWDPGGSLAPLHKMNPARLRFIRETVVPTPADPGRPFAGKTLLDVGCGGGLLAEPLARLGASVTGIDPERRSVAVARAHAEAEGLKIAYRRTTAEHLVAAGERFDVVIASEVVEHVEEQPAFVATLAALTAPGGVLCLSTLNRTRRAFVEAILGAEYLLGWLPRGTHRWQRFVKPAELAAWLRRADFAVQRLDGIGWNGLEDSFELQTDVPVNYILAARRLGE
ncbi:MAG: bifunctional 2-polyprenyl-6-hydroxyphenol methylase/3-demethylubiquinol 3-O-methyltransferase UbiG [Pseudomonadota bacterium]